MDKFLKRLFGRVFFMMLAVILQTLWFILFMELLGRRYPVFGGAIRAVAVMLVLWVMNMRINPSYKLAWCFLILALPVVGLSVYFLYGRSRLTAKAANAFTNAAAKSAAMLHEEAESRQALEDASQLASRQSAYLRDFALSPVYAGTETEYYPEGELLYEAMVRELEKAEKFIFLEYFIIDNGEMWSTILDILERKAKEGLDVRVIYDDVGCVNTLPEHFYKELRERGIACEVFNPFKPIVSVIYNNRDHRKIMVIDGCVGFTGGINIADEYINRKKRFGHWKDAGVMLRGEAVWSITVMFLQMWAVVKGDTSELIPESPFRPDLENKYFEHDGFVQPYSDTPLDNETVGENTYLSIISQAKRYVYIFTPYLIIDNEMMTALELAAKSGVDVRIVTPGIPDKKTVFLLTRSYYRQLIDAGVRIYEYTPGFIHAKCFVSDDEIATVGTINLDYRSLYLHFECGVWMYKSHAVMQVREDAMHVFEEADEVTKEEIASAGTFTRLYQSLLRLFAPML